MRKLKSLLFLAGMAAALPAFGAKSVTVAQLEQTLAFAQSTTDADLAERLSGLELTERLSAATLARLRANLPGDKAQQELAILADRSAFLALPADEISADPVPDLATQRQVMTQVVNYVTKTTNQLPNFLAKRDTTSFADRPQGSDYGAKPLGFVTRSSTSVIYRDGQEVVDTAAGKGQKKASAVQGLASWGEFGPILNTVLLDAAQSKLAWSHWEQGATGSEMVFAIEVPAKKSHYQVQYCCVSDDLVYRGESNPLNSHVFHELAGYRGEIAVDPASGAVLRVALQAELTPGDPLTAAAIMVEYGPVDIGGKSFICPLRSVALSQQRIEQPTMGAPLNPAFSQSPIQTLLNDVAFEQYHRLGSEMRIVADTESNSTQGQTIALANPADLSSAQPPSPAGAETSAAPDGSSSQSFVAPAAKLADETASAQESPPTPPAAPEPEIDVTAAKGIPDIPANEPAPTSSGFVLKMTSRLVDVGVVVVDKKGRPVKGLKLDDFELYDNGRKQEVKFFNEFAASAMTPVTNSAVSSPASDRTFSNHPTTIATPAAGPPSKEVNTTILLFDESHIAWPDLSNARQQALKFLKALDPEVRVGLYTISSTGFRVLAEVTTDHAAVITKLNKWMPSAASVANSQEEETRNRQQFDTVQNVSDLGAVNGNNNDVPDSSSPVDPQLMNMGANPGRASLIILLQVARHLSSIAGHKNLVWISSDNVFVDWSDLNIGVADKKVGNIDAYALHAQEAMNDAHAAVYPFDVSQLEAPTGGAGADLANANVEVNPATPVPPGGLSSNRSPGRLKAEMLQDLRPIQAPIRELATATGGRTLRRSSDLAGELGSIVEDGRATYQLSFYPDTAADDQYHAVNVKIVDKKGLTLRGRTGYLYGKEPTSMKDRFRQAIWLPKDASEIGVAATIGEDPSGATVKLNIAAADLDLQQQSGRWMDKLDIFFIQRDQAGLHADLEGKTLGLRLLPASYQSLLADGLPLEHSLKIKQGMDSLRVLVVDEANGRMGSVTVPASAIAAKP